ncbi:MAG: hypothetical protein ABI321_11810 [Polyangia bacterium]
MMGRRAVLASIFAAASGCSFVVPGFPVGTDGAVPDAALFVDAAHGAAFVPAHVPPNAVVPGASKLSDVRDIDTERLYIDGATPMPGIVFSADPGNDDWAVLSVHDLTITHDVLVHGRRALIVVAVGSIEVGATMHAGADLRSPGPGGQRTGEGPGSDGKKSSTNDSGGGGAGHGTVGAVGGASASNSNGQGGAGGIAYDDELAGGSGGGTGSGAVGGDDPCPTNQGYSLGGAGGGVVQLSAGVSIDVLFAGIIEAGGGGGRAGCKESASAGGGGGAGGSLWLEAPTMNLAGKITANGGAGGSGGRANGSDSNDGQDGQDGQPSTTPAQGGQSPGMGGGAGGQGGVLGVAPTPGDKSTNGGGGGGAVGRIVLRTRTSSPITSASTVISPAPEKSVDF